MFQPGAPDDAIDSSPTYRTAICNERGQCGTVSVRGQWGDGTEVGIPVIDIGDGLWSIDVPITSGMIITYYDVEVTFLGETQIILYNAEVIEDKQLAALSDPTFDPRYTLPSSEYPHEDPNDLRCRDSNGNLTGEGESQSSDANDGSYDIDDYTDYWDYYYNDWEEGYGGQVPVCTGDFSDPYVTTVRCTR